MREVAVKTRDNGYDILVAQELPRCTEFLKRLTAVAGGRSCMLLSDQNVWPLYGASVRDVLREAGAKIASVEVVEAGEQSKSLPVVSYLYEKAVAAGLDRRSMLVALGGGVVGDLGGFAAATFLRGIDFIQWPTTLLAQVDSSVGGKVAVDLPSGKNLVGAFHQPSLVACDLQTLPTLPDSEFRCGLAEVVKYGMIMDYDFFTFLGRNIESVNSRSPEIMAEVVTHCCALKARVVAADEKESGPREVLNYGHTFGHALEVLGGYGSLTHGEAVAVGMSMAVDLAVACGLTSIEAAHEQEDLLKKFGLPTVSPFPIDSERALEIMRRDKKSRLQRLRLVLPSRIGHASTVEGIDEALVKRALEGRCGNQ